MKKVPDEQLRLDLDDPEEPRPARRATRRRFPDMSRALPRKRPQQPADAALLLSPEVTRCGFCGKKLTVLEEVVVCPHCGGIVSRPQEDD